MIEIITIFILGIALVLTLFENYSVRRENLELKEALKRRYAQSQN